MTSLRDVRAIRRDAEVRGRDTDREMYFGVRRRCASQRDAARIIRRSGAQ